MVKIGLEVHGYISTNKKLFCNCKSIHGVKYSNTNTNICPVCTGQPGAKPMLPNKNAVDKAIKIALILNCKVNNKLTWQRKHYDWPDLPKGYQNTISGPHTIPNGEKGEFLGIKIREVHLEEDPAAWNPTTGEIDYNRSGSPLIEIVTEPDFTSSFQVTEWLKELTAVLSYIKAIDKNSGLKADVNISLPELKAQEILRTWIPKSSSPKAFAKSQSTISNKSEIEKLASKVIKENKKAVEDYKSGKTWAINFLVGQIMKLSNKRADFNVAKQILEKKLK